MRSKRSLLGTWVGLQVGDSVSEIKVTIKAFILDVVPLKMGLLLGQLFLNIAATVRF